MLPQSPSSPRSQPSINRNHLFLHLSDIHFRNKVSNDPYDLDVDLRRQLERDAVGFIQDRHFEKVNALLITGDIAFGGHENEYKIARGWLNSLADILKCHPRIILTTPGNHDIDRNIYLDSREETLRMWQSRLRSSSPENLDHNLTALFRDPTARAKIYEPLKNYNIFAAEYGCDINPERPCWDRRLDLDEQIVLRIRGLNSALASNPLDDTEPRKLCLGLRQVQVDDADRRVIHLTLCHHPPDWLIDHDQVHLYLSDRVHLQLFGHKHSQIVDITNNRIRMTAGAVHPSRSEVNWVPRYNFIEIWITRSAGEHYVHFRIYPRVWKGTRFGADYQAYGIDFKEHTISLGRITSTTEPNLDMVSSQVGETKVPILSVNEPLEIALEESVEAISEEESTMSTSSTYAPVLVRRFLNLGIYERSRIINQLGLNSPPEASVSEQGTLKLVFSRAKERRLLGELWDKVEAAHHDGLYQFNPFEGK